MQGFFEQATRLEMRLAPSGHVDDLAGAWIAGGRLGPGVFDLKNPEAADLDAIAFDETIAHGGKETVNELGGEIFFAAGVVTDEEGQFFFGERRQMLFLRGEVEQRSLGNYLVLPYLLGNMMLGKVLSACDHVNNNLDNPNAPHMRQKIAPRAPLFP